MKYTCNVCGYTGEGEVHNCPMCGSADLRFEGTSQTSGNSGANTAVYPCVIARPYTASSMLVQFSNNAWGVLEFDGGQIPADMTLGKKINVTIAGYDQQGYPHVCVSGEPDIAEKEQSVAQDENITETYEASTDIADIDGEVENQGEDTYEVVAVADVTGGMFDEAVSDVQSGNSWQHWHETPIGHEAARKAVFSLQKFINTYIRDMYNERNSIANEKERLRAGFESQKKNIQEEYNKTMQESKTVHNARIQSIRGNIVKADKIAEIGRYYVEAIPQNFGIARKEAGVYQYRVERDQNAAKNKLRQQLQLMQQLAKVDSALITEKFNDKLNDAQVEYDRSSTQIEQKFADYVEELKRSSADDIAQGFSKSDIASYVSLVKSSKLDEINYESPKRLPEYINLGTMCIDIDTSVDVDHISIAHIVEQQTLDIINKDENAFTVALPYCQRLLDGISMFVTYDEQDRTLIRDKIQPLLLKMFMYFPAGRLEATMIDPLEMGTSFQGIPKLAGITNERIIDTKIWSKESDIERAIATLRLRMETLNQSYNGDRASRFQKEAVKILAITDFPVGFTNGALKDLQAIVRNSASLGVCVLIWANNKELVKFRERNESLYQEIVSNLVITNAEGEKLRFENSQVYLRLDSMSDILTNNDKIINIIKNNIDHCTTKIERFEDMMRYDIEDSNNWFTGNDHEIAVPIGIKGADTVVSMVLGRGGGSTEHHVLIAGQTGAGKTTLMHTLIMSTLLQYSPEDVQMYLVDFKEGVAFKPYTKYRLPSLRVVAIDSEREFGYTILQELCNELENRADIFSREEVEDINDYNDIPNVKKVPKILLIFDEVQELFRSRGNEDAITKGCLSAIGKLVTQGRALGIHLILACQDFAHCQGLQSYFSQMAVRIAVKGSEESAASILNADNQGVRTLQNQPAGSAIYNRSGGVESANTFFQVAYMNKDDRLNLLKKMDEYYTNSVIADKFKDCTTRILLTNAEDNINNKFNQLIRYGFDEKLEKIGKTKTSYGIQMGQGFGKNIDFTVNIERERGNNLLVVGKNEKKAMSIFEFSVMSVLYDELFTDNDATSTLVYIADMSGQELRDDTCSLRYLQEVLPDQVTVVSLAQLERLIDSVYRIAADRKQRNAVNEKPIFLMLFGINRAKSITINRMYDEEEQSITTVEKLNTIFKYGPELGIHSIIWGEQPSSTKRILGDRYDGFFDLRVAFDLPAEDMYNVVSEEDRGSLNESTAVYINIVQDIKNKHFRPYAIPAKVWIDEFADVYAETTEE